MKKPKASAKPRILFYDIETAPNLAYVWGKYEQNVLSYVEEWSILCFAYKWQGDRSVKVVRCRTHGNDKAAVKKLHKLFSEADAVVAHNGDAFDFKKVKARFIYHDLDPTPHVPTIDTKKMAKKHFAFNSNSLNDLGQHLGLGKKVPHQGFSLWLGCMQGDPKAWDTMMKYNKQDVVLLEKVYDKLLPWATSHPNMALLKGGSKDDCPNCGSAKTKSRGRYATARGLKQRRQCTSCSSQYSIPMRGIR